MAQALSAMPGAGWRAVAIGCAAGCRLGPLAPALVTVKVRDRTGHEETLVSAAASWRVLDSETLDAHLGGGRKTPVSDYLHGLLRDRARELVPVDAEYDRLFDQVEYLLGVVCTARSVAARSGAVWRSENRLGQGQPAAALERHRAELLDAGLFEGSDEKLVAANASYNESCPTSGLNW